MPSGFGELGGGEVVVGALVAPGGDGSRCVGISGSEVFTVRSTLGMYCQWYARTWTLWPAIFGRRELGTLETHALLWFYTSTG